MMYEISRTLIRLGIIFIIVGILIKLIPSFDFAPLPGDVIIKRNNFTFYFPITTMIVVSIILTILVNIFFRK